jgi:hypothetical protein
MSYEAVLHYYDCCPVCRQPDVEINDRVVKAHRDGIGKWCPMSGQETEPRSAEGWPDY